LLLLEILSVWSLVRSSRWSWVWGVGAVWLGPPTCDRSALYGKMLECFHQKP